MAKVPNVPVKWSAEINKPSLAGASYIKPAVQPSEALMAGRDADNALLGTIGKALLDYNVADKQVDLENKHMESINNYMDRRQEGQERLAMEAADLDKTATEMLYAGARPEEIHPVLKEFQNRFDRLQKAREQGIMSPAELSTKILADTREAVAKWPGLYPQILQHSEKVLELSGIKSIVELDQANAKARQEEQDKIKSEMRAVARTLNIPIDYRNVDYDKLNEQISHIQSGVQASEKLKRISDGQEILTKQEAQRWVFNNAPNYIIGDATEVLAQFSQTIPKSPQDYEQWLFQLKDTVGGYKDKLSAIVTGRGIVADPNVAAAVKMHQESLDGLVERMERLGSGEDAATIMKNYYNRLLDSQRLRFAERYDIATLEAMKLIPDSIYANHAVKHNILGLVELANGLVTEAINSPGFRRGLVTDTINAGKVDSISTVFGFLDNGSKAMFEKGVETLTKATVDEPMFETEDQQKNWLHQFVDELADPARKGQFSKLSVNATEDIYKLVDNYVEKASLWKDRTIKDYEARGIHVQADVRPDGSIVFKSNNPQAEREMNRNFAGPLNKSMQALANTFNMDTKDALEIAVKRYQQQIFGKRDTGVRRITPMPSTAPTERVVLRTPADVKAALDAGKISKEDADITLTADKAGLGNDIPLE